MPPIRKIDGTRTKKEDRKKSAPPAAKKEEALTTNDTKPAVKQGRDGNNQLTSKREAPQHDMNGSESFQKDTEQRDLVDSADNEELIAKKSPLPKAQTKKKSRKNA